MRSPGRAARGWNSISRSSRASWSSPAKIGNRSTMVWMRRPRSVSRAAWRRCSVVQLRLEARSGASRHRWSPCRTRVASRSTAAKASGLSVIEISAPARIRSRPSGGSRPSDRPSPARMKENSPIWARLAATVRAVRGRIAQQQDDAEGDERLADHDERDHRQPRPAARAAGSTGRTACRRRRRTGRRRRPAAAASPPPPGG